MNKWLPPLCEEVANKDCLVLDGSSCNSVQSLLSCTKQQRTKSNIYVPNICTATYEVIKGRDICIPYHGSIRAFLDTFSTQRFGLLYLDYCSRIGAGRGHIEKSPISDIEAIFRYGVCDTKGCVLVICICKEGAGSSLDSPQLLRYVVSHYGSLYGYVVVPSIQRFDYAGTYTEVFNISTREYMQDTIDIDKLLKSCNLLAPKEDSDL